MKVNKLYVSTNSVIASWRGPNKLCRYKWVPLSARCMVQLKETHFKTKYRPVSILLDFYAVFFAILRTRLKSKRQLYTQSKLPFLLSFHRPGIDVRNSAVWNSRGRECGWFLTIVCIAENYWDRDCQCRYIRGRCFYVCRTKQGRKTLVLWEISWYRRMYNVIDEMSHKPRSLQPSSTRIIASVGRAKYGLFWE